MVGISRERAKRAFDLAKQLENEKKDLRDRYVSYVKRLGPMILMCGLGQALASEKAAAGSGDNSSRAHEKLYNNLKEWLTDSRFGVYPDEGDLLEALVKSSQYKYLRAQAEALWWLEWHKKFCEAYLSTNDKKAAGDGNSDGAGNTQEE